MCEPFSFLVVVFADLVAKSLHSKGLQEQGEKLSEDLHQQLAKKIGTLGFTFYSFFSISNQTVFTISKKIGIDGVLYPCRRMGCTEHGKHCTTEYSFYRVSLS